MNHLKLVIAEKPSVGMTIAAVLGANVRQEGYLEGNGYIVSWCFGHLAELARAEAYDDAYTKWRCDQLPIVPDVWRVTVARDKRKQLRRAKKLIQKRCCNYDHGNCLALDDGEFCECVQCRTYSLLCKWFCDAVLPTDTKLAKELQKEPIRQKQCQNCGHFFRPGSNRALYCPRCAIVMERRKTRNRVRRYRDGV